MMRNTLLLLVLHSDYFIRQYTLGWVITWLFAERLERAQIKSRYVFLALLVYCACDLLQHFTRQIANIYAAIYGSTSTAHG